MQIKNGLQLYSFLLSLVCASLAHADSPVWRVSKGEMNLYLGGTIHVLSPADYPLPAGFNLAYQQSDKMIFETDFAQLKSPETQQKLLLKSLYPGDKTLKSVLSPETWQQLEKHLSERGLPADTMLKFKPGMMIMVLTMIELQRLGLAGTGVDEFYALQAINDGRTLGKLETIDEQLDFVTNLGKGREDALIAYTLRDLEKLPTLLKKLKSSWRQGDVQQLNTLMLVPVQRDYPQIYSQLLVNRNKAWVPKIEAMLKDKEVEMVLVGALHLVGKDGLLNQLKAKGYQVERL
jgi:uncharacterized protein YbaP (TraB family)